MNYQQLSVSVCAAWARGPSATTYLGPGFDSEAGTPVSGKTCDGVLCLCLKLVAEADSGPEDEGKRMSTQIQYNVHLKHKVILLPLPTSTYEAEDMKSIQQLCIFLLPHDPSS